MAYVIKIVGKPYVSGHKFEGMPVRRYINKAQFYFHIINGIKKPVPFSLN